MEYNDFIDLANCAGHELEADTVTRSAVTRSANVAPLRWAVAAAVACMLVPLSTLFGKTESSEPLATRVAQQTAVAYDPSAQPRLLTAWNNSHKYKQYIESYENRNVL